MYYHTIVLLIISELAVGNEFNVGIIVLHYSVLYDFCFVSVVKHIFIYIMHCSIRSDLSQVHDLLGVMLHIYCFYCCGCCRGFTLNN